MKLTRKELTSVIKKELFLETGPDVMEKPSDTITPEDKNKVKNIQNQKEIENKYIEKEIKKSKNKDMSKASTISKVDDNKIKAGVDAAVKMMDKNAVAFGKTLSGQKNNAAIIKSLASVNDIIVDKTNSSAVKARKENVLSYLSQYKIPIKGQFKKGFFNFALFRKCDKCPSGFFLRSQPNRIPQCMSTGYHDNYLTYLFNQLSVAEKQYWYNFDIKDPYKARRPATISGQIRTFGDAQGEMLLRHLKERQEKLLGSVSSRELVQAGIIEKTNNIFSISFVVDALQPLLIERIFSLKKGGIRDSRLGFFINELIGLHDLYLDVQMIKSIHYFMIQYGPYGKSSKGTKVTDKTIIKKLEAVASGRLAAIAAYSVGLGITIATAGRGKEAARQLTGTGGSQLIKRIVTALFKLTKLVMKKIKEKLGSAGAKKAAKTGVSTGQETGKRLGSEDEKNIKESNMIITKKEIQYLIREFLQNDTADYQKQKYSDSDYNKDQFDNDLNIISRNIITNHPEIVEKVNNFDLDIKSKIKSFNSLSVEQQIKLAYTMNYNQINESKENLQDYKTEQEIDKLSGNEIKALYNEVLKYKADQTKLNWLFITGLTMGGSIAATGGVPFIVILTLISIRLFGDCIKSYYKLASHGKDDESETEFQRRDISDLLYLENEQEKNQIKIILRNLRRFLTNYPEKIRKL